MRYGWKIVSKNLFWLYFAPFDWYYSPWNLGLFFIYFFNFLFRILSIFNTQWRDGRRFKKKKLRVHLVRVFEQFLCLNTENYGSKKEILFGKGVLYWSVWVRLLILGCLKTEFRKLLLPIFNFQMTLLNDTFVNMLKTIGSTWLNKT